VRDRNVQLQVLALQEAAAQLGDALLAITAEPANMSDQGALTLVNDILRNRTQFRFRLHL
jgi:hypothetical protein